MKWEWNIILISWNEFITIRINSLWPSDAILRRKYGSKSAQCWLIKGVLLHSFDSKFTRSAHRLNPWHVFGDYIYSIIVTSSRVQGLRVSISSNHSPPTSPLRKVRLIKTQAALVYGLQKIRYNNYYLTATCFEMIIANMKHDLWTYWNILPIFRIKLSTKIHPLISNKDKTCFIMLSKQRHDLVLHSNIGICFDQKKI